MSRYDYRRTKGAVPCPQKANHGFTCDAPARFAVVPGALVEGAIGAYEVTCPLHLSATVLRASQGGRKYASVVPLAHLVIGGK